RSMKALYREAWTPWAWFPGLFDHAKRVGIECFASVFDHASLRFLENLGCPRYKIASFEIVDLPLIDAVAGTGKPIIISTGMASEKEIDAAWGLADATCHDVTLLKCTSAYPATAASANLSTMLGMAAAYSSVGVSDHTLGIAVPVAATALGATMIEKHLTLNRSDGGPDAAFSSEPAEFKAMVDACRQADLAHGSMRYGPTEAEMPSLQFRRSLYWATAVPKGTIVEAKHLRTARPALGAPCADLPKYIGRIASRDIDFGDPVSLDDVGLFVR
ncbi:MAG: N-acetylneuraminate synthase family protein, partial [Candidatus Nanopelagicales bacterium]